jgi:hypothetical protein
MSTRCFYRCIGVLQLQYFNRDVYFNRHILLLRAEHQLHHASGVAGSQQRAHRGFDVFHLALQ